jgi:hypothetical protein
MRVARCVGGKDATVAQWKEYAAEKDVHVTVINAGNTHGIDPYDTCPVMVGACQQLATTTINMATLVSSFGNDPTRVPSSAAAYVSLLHDEVIVAKGDSPTVTVTPTISVKYPDGTTSTDVTASVTPSSATAVKGSTAVPFKVTATAKASADLATPRKTTTVYVEYKAGDSVVARQTISFEPPAISGVAIQYVDDDAGGAVVAPKSGTQTTMTGSVGDLVGFTEAMAKAGVPDNYDYVSLTNVLQYAAAAQFITIHVKHHHTVTPLETTRTVRYDGADDRNPDPVVQPQAWTVDTDDVTGAKVYAASAGLDEVPTPELAGYSVDVDLVPATDPVPSRTTAPTDWEVVVTYSPIHTLSTLTVTRTVHYAGAGDKTPADVVQEQEWDVDLDESTGVAVYSAQAGYAAVDSPDVKGWLPDVLSVPATDPVAEQLEAPEDSEVVVTYAPIISGSTLETTRTIHYQGAGDKTPADVVQKQTWTVVLDESTGVATFSAAEGYTPVVSPTVSGYKADVATVPETDPVAAQAERPSDTRVVVTYEAVEAPEVPIAPAPGPGEGSVKVVYVDDDAAGAVVEPGKGAKSALTGTVGDAVAYTEADAKAGVPIGYDYVSYAAVTAFAADEQTITVHLKHHHTVTALKTVRTIHYVDLDGKQVAADAKQTQDWSADADDVTLAVVYAAAKGYAAVDSPAITGMTADTAVVPATAAVASQAARPTDTEVTVKYATNVVVVAGQPAPASPTGTAAVGLLLVLAGVSLGTFAARRKAVYQR